MKIGRNLLTILFLLSLVFSLIFSISFPTQPLIKMGCSNSPGWNPWEITKEAQIFKNNNLNVDLIWFDNYANSISVMLAGEIDANCQTLDQTLTCITKGVDEAIILATDKSVGNNKVIAREEIRSARDLKGKQVAVELGSVDHFLLLLGLKDIGLSQDDIQLRAMPALASVKTFLEGKVDAVSVPAPLTKIALERPGSKEIFSSEDFPDVISGHLVVSRELIKKKPHVAQALVKSWFDTLQYMRSKPEQSYKIMAKQAKVSVANYQAYDPGSQLLGVTGNLIAFETKNEMSSLPFTARQVSKFLLENGLIKDYPNSSKLFEPRFVEAYTQENK